MNPCSLDSRIYTLITTLYWSPKWSDIDWIHGYAAEKNSSQILVTLTSFINGLLACLCYTYIAGQQAPVCPPYNIHIGETMCVCVFFFLG